jgi:hypothetical protein
MAKHPSVLYTMAEIRRVVRAVMRASSGARIAIVAFIGAKPQSYIPKPQGTTIYCAADVIFTHPRGLQWLLEHMGDALALYFVPSLHMKIFWSSRGGAFVGSANLTHNALHGPSREAGTYFSASDAVPINTIVASLEGAKLVTPARLATFWRKWSAGRAKRERTDNPTVATDVLAYAGSPYRQPFKIAFWSEYTHEFSVTARGAAAEEFGVTVTAENAHRYIDEEIEDLPPRLFSRGDWALTLKTNAHETRITACDWIYVSRVFSPRRKHGKRGRQRIIEMGRVHRDPEPFVFDKLRLRKALNAILANQPRLYGNGLSINGFAPNDAFIAALAKYYAKV